MRDDKEHIFYRGAHGPQKILVQPLSDYKDGDYIEVISEVDQDFGSR